MKKLLESKLKALPEAQRNQLISMVEQNPDLFTKIAEEVQAKVSGGMSQTNAMMLVMKAHEAELRKLASNK